MLDIELINTGEHFDCQEDETLLAGMTRWGRRGIPVGCRGGGCGVCKVRVLSGSCRALKMSTAHITQADHAMHMVLACRAFPTTPMRLDIEGGIRKSFLKYS